MQIEELNGKRVQVSARTITIKDENNKTRGMIRNVDNLYDIRPNKQIEFAKKLRSIDRGLYTGKMDQILIFDDKMYFLCDDYSLSISQKLEGDGYAKLISAFEDCEEVTVIHCVRVSRSERRR